LEDKDRQLERLSALEIENAELKAKNLLESFDSKKEEFKPNSNKKKNGFTFYATEKTLNITNISQGTQTGEKYFSQEYVSSIEQEINELNKKNENYRKEFQDHRERSNKIILSTEENYKKLLKENETLKFTIDSLNNTINDLNIQNKNLTLNNNTSLSSNDLRLLNNIKNKSLNDSKNTLTNQNITMLNPNMSIIEIEKQIINIEYLKNILVKYLEAIAIGNEFQIKILENVIFAVLSISDSEKANLEEKRSRSSFYYNLWYNAKAFLSAKIYGNGISIPTHFPEGSKDNHNGISLQNETSEIAPKNRNLSSEEKKEQNDTY